MLPTNMGGGGGGGGGGMYGGGDSTGGSGGGSVRGTWGGDIPCAGSAGSFSNLGSIGGGDKRSRGGLLSVMHFLKAQRDKVLPQFNSQLSRAGLGKDKVRTV